MDFKAVLQRLAAELLEKHRFRPSDVPEEERRRFVLRNCTDLMILELFVEWLERAYEARNILASHGLGWGEAVTQREIVRPVVPVPVDRV